MLQWVVGGFGAVIMALSGALYSQTVDTLVHVSQAQMSIIETLGRLDERVKNLEGTR